MRKYLSSSGYFYSLKYEYTASEICEKILQSTNYYDTLMIDRESDYVEIRRQYKLLALKIHPDKHSGSQATQAFIHISKAFNWFFTLSFGSLSDPQKREAYNKEYYDINQNRYEARLYTLGILIPFLLMIIIAWILQVHKTNNKY